MQPVGIVFKGSGFYKTDNASSGSRKDRADQEKKDKGDDKPSTEPKPADKSAKPEPKAEAKAQNKSEPAPAKSETKD
jgi:hypothetical protein